ncbi:serine--tRNA ligase, mitochondrial [Anoplophora glabripennis]|uniref:serine--tRNA ligase, mitochondrial n=1 Tax=Anoplophora glabripennis TaxID=217634 RepID=UPI000874D631|nr:serine--tRNA ligase, mitochondrial [Anoplophora glabripennis]
MIKNVNIFLILNKNVKYFHTNCGLLWNLPNYAELDVDYLCNEKNVENIANNIINRKGVGNIKAVNELKLKLDNTQPDEKNYETLRNKFYEELFKIPNKTHPEVFTYGGKPKLVKNVNSKKEFDFKPREFHEISKRLNLVRTEQLGNVCGNRSYYLLGEMAELEQALVSYCLERLIHNKFQLLSVPDILPRDVVERCGMNTKGERNQVYALDPDVYGPDLCLSGTSEIALAGYLTNKLFSEDELPLKLAAVSRCYRAETSSVSEERGIFRVHEFTKVEMFIVSTPEKSDEALEDIRILQEENFESLGLHFQVLDMPPHELGAQAYRKYDIEAWMPGRGLYGEISSCSNCTDFQSRRFGIKYKTREGQVGFVHTLNGTACAVPRLLIALTETEQGNKGTIHIPHVLQRFMRGKTSIGRQKSVPELKLIKNKKQ